MTILPSVSLITKSKKLIFSLNFSCVNLRLAWNSLRSFRNLFKFSPESIQINSQGFMACVFKNSLSVHENVSIRRGKFSPNSRASYLLIKFKIKFKKIIFKYKICHFYDIFSGNDFVFEFIVLFPKDFQAFIMWNTCIKPKHIYCNKDFCFGKENLQYAFYTNHLVSWVVVSGDLRIPKFFLWASHSLKLPGVLGLCLNFYGS